MLRGIVIALLLLLAACSLRSAIETFTSEQDRVFAHDMVERLRAGDTFWLEPRFSHELWAMSTVPLARAPALFPREPGETQIVSAQVSTDISGGISRRERGFTLVTSGDGQWTVTRFRTLSQGGPDEVVQWSVTRQHLPPIELQLMHGWDRALGWLRILGPLALFAVIGLIVWIVRHNRRGRDPLMGRRD
ncbi:MAG: hypothetical protein ACT4OE_05335 [Sphingosinicella sp.]